MEEHYISESNTHHVCGVCGQTASHKIEEHIPSDEPGQSEFESQRHEFTNWVCCVHFGHIMGPAAVAWCRQDNKIKPVSPWLKDLLYSDDGGYEEFE